MIQHRKAQDRGHFDHGWLDTYHTFSFADYHDPAHRGFRALRVINEDRVMPGRGFDTHGHRDMEIITCVLEGALKHQDSLGNGSTIRPGELQRMSAGTGIEHSEFNPSDSEWVHLYQIWLFPRQRGLTPSYEQRSFSEEQKRGRFCLVASPNGAAGSLTIQQDAMVYLATVTPGQAVSQSIATGRAAWLQVLRGAVESFGVQLAAGDGMALSEKESVRLLGATDAEVLLFDLA